MKRGAKYLFLLAAVVQSGKPEIDMLIRRQESRL